MGCCDTIAGGGSVGPGGPACEVVLGPVAGDNGAYLTAQIAALSAAGGGTICLAPGTYTQDTSVLLASNVSIKGAGESTILTWRAGHVGTNDITDRSNFSSDPAVPVSGIDIYNLAVDGNRAGIVSARNAINLDSVTNVRVRNVHMYDMFLDGVYITRGAVAQSDGVIVEACIFDNCGRNSVSLVSGINLAFTDLISRDPINGHIDIEPNLVTQIIQGVTFENFRGIDTTLTGAAAVVLITTAGTILDVNFSNMLIDTARLALLIGSAGAIAISRIILSGCVFRGQTGAWGASLCQIVAPSVDVQLIGCRIQVSAFNVAGAGEGLRINNASDVRVTGTRIVSDTATAGRRSLYVTGTTGANNHVLIEGCDLDGPVMFENVRNVDLVGSDILCTGTTVTSLHLDDVATCHVDDTTIRGGNIQIYFTGTGSDILISDNLLAEANSYGIYGADANVATRRVEIRGNHLRSTVAALNRLVVLAPRFVFQENGAEQDSGTAGHVVLVQSDCIVDGNIVRSGTAANSIVVNAGSTGYTCSYNRTSTPVVLAGVPAEAVNNALIVV